jgi:hypothetical protein
MTGTTHPNYIYRLPEEFISAQRKDIIIRECYATLLNPHRPRVYEVGDVCLHASFCWEEPTQYCCLVNSPCKIKKKYEFLGGATEFVITFRTVDGLSIQPDTYLLDFLLEYE